MIPKFRAWHKKEKKMCEVIRLEWLKTKPIGDPNYRSFWIRARINNKIIACRKSEIILMQSTGLKDKNGKEIFEGDIVEFETIKGTRCEVKKDLTGTYWVYTYIPTCKVCRPCYLYDVSNNMEVIGNIHENPELLKEADKG